MAVINDTFWYYWTNQSSGGLIQAVINGTFDATLPLWIHSTEREKLVDFTEAGMPVPFYFATRKFEGANRLQFTSLTSSLRWKVWLCVGISILLISLFIFAIEKRDRKLRQFIDAILITSVFLIRKALPLRRMKISTRFLMVFWGISAILITSAYTGGLLSSMLRISSKPPFDDFDSLLNCLESFRCKMILQQEDDWFRGFLEDKSSKYFTISQTFDTNPPLFVDTIKKQFETIKKNSGIFLVSEMNLMMDFNLYNVSTCELYLVEEMGEFRFLFRKGHKHLKVFNAQTKRVKQSGLMVPLIHKYLQIEQPCDAVQKAAAKPIRSDYVLTPILVLFFGIVFAFIFLVHERITANGY